jgi:uncharacterized protein YndB with AHSA1/START domain
MITKTIWLALTVEAAFGLFTQEISLWWPAERRHTDDPNSKLFVQPDGRFFERASDGREVEIGKVTAWEPPHRLAFDFYPATGPEHPTQVVIVFAADNGGTRLTVSHAPKPESKHLWDDRVPRYARSWDLVLAALNRAVSR